MSSCFQVIEGTKDAYRDGPESEEDLLRRSKLLESQFGESECGCPWSPGKSVQR
jgi:hypothetical protein